MTQEWNQKPSTKETSVPTTTFPFRPPSKRPWLAGRIFISDSLRATERAGTGGPQGRRRAPPGGLGRRSPKSVTRLDNPAPAGNVAPLARLGFAIKSKFWT
jgi:hypothetical protein